MKILIRSALIAILGLTLSGCRLVTETVPYVDIERYMGLWYQISANEVSFNEGLVGVTAEYTLLDDGSVEVYNKGYQDTLDGEDSDIVGNAVVAVPETNAALKVEFPDVPDTLLPNYLIVVLDDIDYQYAVVTDPFQYTLFVLSRTPQMDANTYAMILGMLEVQGIDTSDLLLTPQPAS